jgi:carbamoyl-phosphate synthase large subunit
MGIDESFAMAFAKSQLAANTTLPTQGKIFISVADRDKREVLSIARSLAEMGYALLSTRGTGQMLRSAGVPVVNCPRSRKAGPTSSIT